MARGAPRNGEGVGGGSRPDRVGTASEASTGPEATSEDHEGHEHSTLSPRSTAEVQAEVEGGQRGLRIIAFTILGVIAASSLGTNMLVGLLVLNLNPKLDQTQKDLATVSQQLNSTQLDLKQAQQDRRDLQIVAVALQQQLERAGIAPEIRIPLPSSNDGTNINPPPTTTTTTTAPRRSGQQGAAPPGSTTTTRPTAGGGGGDSGGTPPPTTQPPHRPPPVVTVPSTPLDPIVGPVCDSIEELLNLC